MHEWTLMAHRSELKKAGDYVQIAGKVAYFDGKNVSCWNGLCPHRGSRLFPAASGNHIMRCGYHGWTEQAILNKITPFLQAWVGDWLFCGAGVVQLEDQLGDDCLELLDGTSKNIERRYSHDLIDMACDWRIAVENALEDYHVAHIHPESIGKIGLRLDLISACKRNSAALYDITDRRTAAMLSYEGVGRYFKLGAAPEYGHVLIYPFTCLSSVGGLTYSLQHYVSTETGTQLSTRLYTSPVAEGSPDLGFFFENARQFNLQVFREDAAICATVKGFGEVLTPAEDRIKWFREAHEMG